MAAADSFSSSASFAQSSLSTGMALSATSSNDTFLMPASPARRSYGDAHTPTVRRTLGQRPACLVNASVTYAGDNQIYAFGGFDQYTDEIYNHVLRLDLYTYQWHLVDNFGAIPGVRMGHTAELYKGNKLLIYGGENEHRTFLSDVMLFDLETAHWTQPAISGPQPRGRARHASVLHDDKLFIIGGVTSLDTVLSDICYLDLKTWTWSRSWKFVARFDHNAWVWGGRLWVFGGLGQDMARSNDIWWLDLRENSGFAYPPEFGHLATETTETGLAPASNYAANSRIPTSPVANINLPFAPGHISKHSFIAGPNIPSQSAGRHLHIFSSGNLLDFVTPAQKIRQSECCLTSLHLDTLRWRKLADAAELYKPGYSWHYCAINEEGTKAWLLGSPSGDEFQTGAAEEYLSDVLPIDLKKFGLVGNNLALSSQLDMQDVPSRTGSLTAALSNDLAAMFDVPPESRGMADFVVTAESDIPDDALMSPSDRKHTSLVSSSAKVSQPIYVHKLILQARWPHFSRLYASQMSEFQTKKMHIPEPYSVVRAFLYYLYTDNVSLPKIGVVAGLLVMANIYDLARLRTVCVNRLALELDVEHAALIWERAATAGESWLKRRAAAFVLQHWGRVVRTAAFRDLAKDALWELCQEASSDAMIVGDEAHDVEREATIGVDSEDEEDDPELEEEDDAMDAIE